MSEPFWVGLGGIPVDWAGDWSALTQYQPGDVVTYLGVYYLAVNPSLASTPGPAAGPPLIGISLPLAPVDGQEFILVDSLTAPTYSWKLVYMAAKASNKWLFIGGAPAFVSVAASETSNNQTYVDLGTVGPSFTVPVAGVYDVTIGAALANATSNAHSLMSFAIGATAAVDANAASGRTDTFAATGAGAALSRVSRVTLATAGALVAKYRVPGAFTGNWKDRTMHVVPVAVGG